MSVGEGLSRQVRSRARGQCQYCLMHESLQGATFHIEHIIPRCKGGRSEFENLALACPGCNLHKAGRTSAIDPKTGRQVGLFHPNLQAWSQRFRLDGYEVMGISAEGRATVELLNLNHSRRRRIREVEEAFGLYPTAL